MSFKVEVIADGSGKWVGNLLRFANEDEANKYMHDLAGRWTLVRQMRVADSMDPVNARWSDGAVEHLS